MVIKIILPKAATDLLLDIIWLVSRITGFLLPFIVQGVLRNLLLDPSQRLLNVQCAALISCISFSTLATAETEYECKADGMHDFGKSSGMLCVGTRELCGECGGRSRYVCTEGVYQDYRALRFRITEVWEETTGLGERTEITESFINVTHNSTVG